MKTILQICFWLSISVLLSNCRNEESKFSVVDLEKANTPMDVNINEIASSWQIIPLETSEKALLGDFLRCWVSDKYIVVADDQAIYQFDPEGRFVRKLANQGKGPNEFSFIGETDGDASLERFYFVDARHAERGIQSIDLINGTFRQPLLAYGNCAFKVLADHNLAVIPTKSADGLGVISPEGKVVWEVSGIRQVPEKYAMFPYFEGISEGILYKKEESDTVFLWREGKEKPWCFLQVDRPFRASGISGNTVMPVWCTSSQLFVRVTDQKIVDIAGMKLRMPVDKKNPYVRYLIDRKNGSVRQVGRWYVESWDCYLLRSFEPVRKGNYIYAVLNAVEIKKIIADKQEAGEKLTEELQKLNAQLKEEDNPVIFVGKVKR